MQTRAPLSIQELQEKARRLRIEVLKMTYQAGSGHPGGSFSMAEFLTALYHNKINVSPAKVELVKLTRSMSLEQFNSQYPPSISLQELAIINEIEDPATPLQAGRTVKRVVGGVKPGS